MVESSPTIVVTICFFDLILSQKRLKLAPTPKISTDWSARSARFAFLKKNSRQMYYHLPKGVFSCVVYEEDEVGHVVEQEEGGEEKLEAPEV